MGCATQAERQVPCSLQGRLMRLEKGVEAALEGRSSFWKQTA
jgi:hypothetical protein